MKSKKKFLSSFLKQFKTWLVIFGVLTFILGTDSFGKVFLWSIVGLVVLYGIDYWSKVKAPTIEQVITAVSSKDNAIQGTITRVEYKLSKAQSSKTDSPQISYFCEVKGNLKGREFARRAEFYELNEAESWLEKTFDLESKKHPEQL